MSIDLGLKIICDHVAGLSTSMIHMENEFKNSSSKLSILKDVNSKLADLSETKKSLKKCNEKLIQKGQDDDLSRLAYANAICNIKNAKASGQRLNTCREFVNNCRALKKEIDATSSEAKLAELKKKVKRIFNQYKGLSTENEEYCCPKVYKDQRKVLSGLIKTKKSKLCEEEDGNCSDNNNRKTRLDQTFESQIRNTKNNTKSSSQPKNSSMNRTFEGHKIHEDSDNETDTSVNRKTRLDQTFERQIRNTNVNNNNNTKSSKSQRKNSLNMTFEGKIASSSSGSDSDTPSSLNHTFESSSQKKGHNHSRK